MQQQDTYIPSHLHAYEIPFGIIRASVLMNKTVTTTIRPTIRKEPAEKPKVSLDKVRFQAQGYISRIKDPLWKLVCIEFINMVGPQPILKIWASNLGPLSLHSETLELSCKTEEIAQILQQYDFVILGILRQYFSTLKKFQISIHSK